MQANNSKRQPQIAAGFKAFWQALKLKFRYLDGWIFGSIMALMVFGTLMVFTSSTNMATGSATSFFIKQVFFAILSTGIMLFLFTIGIRWQSKAYKQFLKWAMIILVGLLAITRFFGPVTSGAHGWLYLFGFGFQPVEYFKIAMILWLAMRFSDVFRNKMAPGKQYLPMLLNYKTTALPAIGMLLDFSMPDFGGFGILLAIAGVMLLTAGVPAIWLLSFIVVIALLLFCMPILIPLLEKVGFMHYQLQRFEAYIDPWNVGYAGHQLINSYYAISNGGFFGRGLGNSIQKLGYLPEPNTDFIMAVVGEELGAISIILVLIVIGIIVWRIMLYGTRTKNMEFRLILYATAMFIMVQVLVNLGGVTGVLPITGVTFPWISYGGSSLLAWGIMMGFVLNIIGRLRLQNEKQK
ncbi:cell division protein FtsW [Weissella uvarum]|uniref:FtsW/RodA/SpoVE family cell cycle protein n=1 Tax=Weissella uvarum TaxID=1479233 RepID=UPI0019604B3F|nr:FtsW/RodA/SpoVE family cell cycle protein [Weissella uvarum]MBM7617523.1 cell division protein FtsW [Weissella uvarum]MCM0595593.1 FtsW/RodA/SpoVE family cell cycle protein [Weissella uvarum]